MDEMMSKRVEARAEPAVAMPATPLMMEKGSMKRAMEEMDGE